MKKILFILTGLMLVLASCSDGGSDSPDNPTPQPTPTPEETASITIDSSITSNGVAFDAKGGEKTVSFSANKDWTLSVATPTNGTVWCTPSATNGVKGDVTVNFTVKENADYDDRSVSVTIKAGTASKTFTITQKGTDALLVTSTKFEVPQEGGSIEVEVKANISYELQISETAKSWISEAKIRALTTNKHTFTIAPSDEYEKREGEIHIKSGGKLEIVKVYQAGGAILMLSKNDCSVSSEGETISVDIKSNIEYGVQMPNVDWITDAPASRAASSHTLKYVVLPNETPDARSAEIIFYDKNSSLKDTLEINQAQKDAIVLSKTEYTMTSEGGTLEIKINSNVDFTTEISTDWIKQTTVSRGLECKQLYFTIDENTAEEEREGTITFIHGELKQTIIVKQHGKLFLTFNNKEMEVMEGVSVELSYTTNFKGLILWKGLDTNIINVSDEGIVTGVNKGETTVIIYSEDGALSDSCKVSVKSITDYISFSNNVSGIQIGGYVLKSISSTIKNNSDCDIELVSFAIYKSETGELYTQTTDSSLLGTLKAGESKSLGVNNIKEDFFPKYVWEYIFEGTRYRNSEKVAGSGTGSTGATGEDMPWQ